MRRRRRKRKMGMNLSLTKSRSCLLGFIAAIPECPMALFTPPRRFLDSRAFLETDHRTNSTTYTPRSSFQSRPECRHLDSRHQVFRIITFTSEMAVPEVNNKLLGELEAMEFSLARATRALHFSGNTSLEAAVNWVIDHENDADIDQFPLVPLEIDIESPKSSPATEEINLRAQELRTREHEIEEKKMEREMQKAQRRHRLGIPVENPATIKPPTHVLQENKNLFPLKSSTMAEHMGECLRCLKRNYMEDDARITRAFRTLLIYVENVAKSPNEEKFRKIRLRNPSFQSRVGSLKGGIEFLELCGFERVEGGEFLFLPRNKVNMAILNSAGSELKNAISNPFFGLLSKG